MSNRRHSASWKHCALRWIQIYSHKMRGIVLVCLLFNLTNISTGLLLHQPVVIAHFDLAIKKTIQDNYNSDLRTELTYLFNDFSKVFSSCVIKSRKLWCSLSHHKSLMHLCGSFGYTDPYSAFLVWTVQQQHPSTGISLIFLQINLPYLGLNCFFANITISSKPGEFFCGRKSNWTIYSNLDLVITLKQGFELYEYSGFIATYYAVDHHIIMNIGKEHHFSIIGEHEIYFSSQLFGMRGNKLMNTWHICGNPYMLITVIGTFNEKCVLYDGPGKLSPIIRKENYTETTGYHLYIQQQSATLSIQYKFIFNLNFQTGDTIDLKSSSTMNTIYGHEINQDDIAFWIKHLSIHSTEILSNFPERCLYGGLFIYARNKESNVFTELIKFCETDINDDFLYQIPNYHAQNFVANLYVVMYASYCSGSVVAGIKNRKCNKYKKNDIIGPGCNQIEIRLWPNDNLKVNILTPFNSYPITFSIHILSLIYNVYTLPVTVSIIDSDLFRIIYHLHTYFVVDKAQGQFDNPRLIRILYDADGKIWSGEHVLKLDFIIQLFCTNTKNGIYNAIGNSALSSVSMEIGAYMCILSLSGYHQYKVALRSISLIHIELHVMFKENDCQVKCSNTSVNITEYNKMADALYVHHFFSVPFTWSNAHSKHSAIVTIEIENEKCLHCSVTITVKPSNYAREISAAFTSQTNLNANLDQHIYKPTRWVSFTNMRAIEFKIMNVDKEMIC